MILTVTLNPALDLTYTVDALVPHGTHRVAAVAERPGGKGLNVAGVLHALGEPVLATGLLGGTTGGRVRELIEAAAVPARFWPIAGETRRTVAVADHDDATGFWEPGPPISASEWTAFLKHFRELLGGASVVALCGSLPPGVPIDGYATLIRAAAGAGVRTVLDTSGEALRCGLRAAPDVAKPNAEELSALRAIDGPAIHLSADCIGRGRDEAGRDRIGRDGVDGNRADRDGAGRGGVDRDGAGRGGVDRDGAGRGGVDRDGAGRGGVDRDGAGRDGVDRDGVDRDGVGAGGADGDWDWVRGLGAGAVVVSRGPRGLLALTPDGAWHAAPPVRLAGNPTGAGDACVAALARGLRDATPWPSLLVDAVALSAAAVAAPVAGVTDHHAYRRLRSAVHVMPA